MHECILQIDLESMVSAYTMFIFEALHSERMQEFIGSRLIPYEQRFVFYEMSAGALSDSASPQPCGRPVDTVVVVQQSLPTSRPRILLHVCHERCQGATSQDSSNPGQVAQGIQTFWQAFLKPTCTVRASTQKLYL